MSEPKHPAPAQAGGDWHGRLRVRLLEVARRRVHADSVEDVVQDALRVIAEKGPPEIGGRTPEGRPALVWCFQVLRHTIGNHYQRERTRRARLAGDTALSRRADPGPAPLEALASREAVGMIHAALEALDREADRCARYLRSLAGGTPVGRLAVEEQVKEAILYRRIYRCREKLRQLLRERGVET